MLEFGGGSWKLLCEFGRFGCELELGNKGKLVSLYIRVIFEIGKLLLVYCENVDK